MHCVSCGAELIPDARFCTRCGARAELGAFLGVGTDLPPVPAPPAVPRLPPEQVVSRTSHHHPGPNGDFSAGRIAAMVATFVVLTILGTFALSQIFGTDTPESPSASESTDTGQGTGDPSPETTPPPSTPESSSAAPSPSASITLPEGARQCSQSGNDAVATAYSGNGDTSCAFTNAVRKAYREAGAATDPQPFRTYSTVTKKWYDMTCDAGPLVRCQSADGAAVVYLGS